MKKTFGKNWVLIKNASRISQLLQLMIYFSTFSLDFSPL